MKRFPYNTKDKAKKWVESFLKRVLDSPLIGPTLSELDYQITLKFQSPEFNLTIDPRTKKIGTAMEGDNATITLSADTFQTYLSSIALATEVCKELTVEGSKAKEFKAYMGKYVNHYIQVYTMFYREKGW